MKKTLAIFLVLGLMAGLALASTYNGTQPKDIDTSTPLVGAFPPAEAGPAQREVKTVLKNLYGFKNVTAASYTGLSTQTAFTYDCSTGNKTLNLPAVATLSSSSAWKSITIIKTDSTANTVTIDAYGSETMDGATTKTLSSQYQGIMLFGNGSTWYSYGLTGVNAALLGGYANYTGTGAFKIVQRRSTGTISGQSDSALTATNSTKAGGFTPLTTATAGSIVVRKYDGTIQGDRRSSDYILMQDEKSSGTQGGTLTTGAWYARQHGTTKADTGSNVVFNHVTCFQLLAGTYRVSAIAPGYKIENHQARMINFTNTSTIALGTSAICINSAQNQMMYSLVNGRFTVASGQVLKLQHRCSGTFSTSGLGIAAGLGVNEVYSVIQLWKEN